ncbi:hypothetical protein DL89DRAFT_26403 [Linderina pennispora]|uniref:ABC transmembrane type-1 domain-containing protein n=1 Tax=Linderina pennispora TaxID=61395 RepID=A0A1Y1WNT7_9FUNG|nr:uncharacterized protein DL89DRAFT_26403 [Linderina pennispora]ORX75045.1 hypothetical protein DL89DRAFT_26403 [Linderina pennispora]
MQLIDQAMWIGRHMDFRMKGLLVGELSTKTLNRRAKGSLEGVTGDDDEDSSDNGLESAQEATNGKIMNLLTTDLNRVTKIVAYLDDLYTLPLSAVIGVIYMFKLLGWSSLIGFSIVIPYYPLTRKLFSYLSDLEEKTLELSDERVEAITELLQGIKAVKLYGWESQFLKKIDAHHEKQLGSMWRWLLGWAYASIVTSLSPMIVMVLILASYTGIFGHQINAEIAFTTISVFQLLRISLEHFPDFLSWVISGYVSLKRIDSYLAMPQAQDLEERICRVDGSDDVLGFVKASLVWDTHGKDSSTNSDDDTGYMAKVDENTPLISDRFDPFRCFIGQPAGAAR